MTRDMLERRLFWLLFALWALSFLLPADSDLTTFGYGLALLSYVSLVLCIGEGPEGPDALFLCYNGLLGLANLPMLVTPFGLSRAQKGKGRLLAALLAVFAIPGTLLPFTPVGREIWGRGIAFPVWVASVFGMAILFLWVAFSRRGAKR